MAIYVLFSPEDQGSSGLFLISSHYRPARLCHPCCLLFLLRRGFTVQTIRERKLDQTGVFSTFLQILNEGHLDKSTPKCSPVPSFLQVRRLALERGKPFHQFPLFLLHLPYRWQRPQTCSPQSEELEATEFHSFNQNHPQHLRYAPYPFSPSFSLASIHMKPSLFMLATGFIKVQFH